VAETLLGRSMALLKSVRPMEVRVFPENAAALPAVYNQAIADAAADPAILVFIHDDVALCDFHFATRIEEGLAHFDILGLAGNKRRLPRQPGWAFAKVENGRFAWDEREYLSGVVGHGEGFPSRNLSVYGPPGQPCALLDGLLLAADSARLIDAGLRFDPRFKFHFYDMDFCRQAELKGLRMGTWPISVVHKSGGSYGGPAWQESYRAYLDKYGD
jgi:hypothetical protein